VFDESVAQFHGVMPYRDGAPESWRASVISAEGPRRRDTISG